MQQNIVVYRIACFVLDIHFSILYVCNWHNRLWTVGVICWDKVSDLPTMGEPYPNKHRRRSGCYCHSSFFLVYSSVEYSCANISVCLVRLRSSLACYVIAIYFQLFS